MRNGTIDALRGLGAVGIVWFHLGLPGAHIAIAALPMFVALLVYFGMGKSLAHQSTRLLVPWIIWCAVYGVLKIADAWASGAPLASEFELWMFATGPAIHLWFLPFCFLYLATLGRLPAPFVSIAALPLALFSLWISNTLALPPPFAQWFTVLAAALMGQLMANAHTPLGPVASFSVIGAIAYALGAQTAALPLALAGLALTFALWKPQKPSGWTQNVAGLSFGIYLAHPAVIAVSLRLGEMSEWDRLLLVIIGSTICTWVLRIVWPASVGAPATSAQAIHAKGAANIATAGKNTVRRAA